MPPTARPGPLQPAVTLAEAVTSTVTLSVTSIVEAASTATDAASTTQAVARTPSRRAAAWAPSKLETSCEPSAAIAVSWASSERRRVVASRAR
ncbi:MAG: hypothetical protein R3B82_17640 [Sandaracinaceae bacterium]